MTKTSQKITKLIVRHPADVLAQVAQPVAIDEITSPKIQNIIKEMSDTLHCSLDGIGIAAPQIGYSLRTFVASEEALRYDEIKDIPEEERDKIIWKHYVFINPEIKKTSRKKLSELEGCLSVPGKFGIMDRAEKVTVAAHDEHGYKFERGTSHLYARLMQHEIDHLNGHLFIEHVKEWVEVEKKK